MGLFPCPQDRKVAGEGLLTCAGPSHRDPEGGSQPAPGPNRTSPALCGTRLAAADPTQRAAPPEEQRVVPWDTLGPRGTRPGLGQRRARGVRRGREQQNQSSGSLKTRVSSRWWYLQILGSPLHAPAVALQGGLALLCGHPMHHGLQLGTPTHPSAPPGPTPLRPLGPSPSFPGSQAWHSPSGSYLLAVQPLARPQGRPSVAVEQWPSGLVAVPLGCCCWWRSWPWGLGQPGAWDEQWQWGQQGLGCWVGAAGAQAGGLALRGSGPHAGSAGSAPSRVGAQAAGSSGCC